jgi:hypothetical protein
MIGSLPNELTMKTKLPIAATIWLFVFADARLAS